MEFDALVRSRKSVRGYKPLPVPRQVIDEIIDVAKRAPSSMNTQPWHVHVLTGEPLDRVRARNTEMMLGGAEVKRDIVTHGPYEGLHRQRQVDVAKQLFEAMDIARDDKPRRQDWVMRGFRQFDAPVRPRTRPGRGLPLRPGCAVLRHRTGRLGPRAGHRGQWPGHHAIGHRARSGRHSR